MKDLTTNQKLFSDIVMFLETSIEHPYLKTRDVGSFDELADALNAGGEYLEVCHIPYIASTDVLCIYTTYIITTRE